MRKILLIFVLMSGVQVCRPIDPTTLILSAVIVGTDVALFTCLCCKQKDETIENREESNPLLSRQPGYQDMSENNDDNDDGGLDS